MSAFSHAFTADQIHHFKEEGYIVLTKVPDARIVAMSKRMMLFKINDHGIAANKNNLEGIPISAEEHKIIWEDVQHSFDPVIHALFGDVTVNDITPEVDILFPTSPIHDVANSPQVNGMKIESFSPSSNQPCMALIAVALTDQTQHMAGNFTIYPKSHIKSTEFFKHQIAEQKTNGISDENIKIGPEGPGWESSLNYPPHAIDGIAPVEITLAQGDLIIIHHKLVHGYTENRSNQMRVNLIWKLKHVLGTENIFSGFSAAISS